jgi:hypothetical protein
VINVSYLVENRDENDIITLQRSLGINRLLNGTFPSEYTAKTIITGLSFFSHISDQNNDFTNGSKLFEKILHFICDRPSTWALSALDYTKVSVDIRIIAISYIRCDK